MRQFLKYLFASFLGTLFAFFIAVLFGALIIGGIISASTSDGSKKGVQPNSVLSLNLDYAIAERTTSDFDPKNFNFDVSSELGLNDIIKNIKYAKTDDKIKGIYLNVGILPAGFATVDAIRNALTDFKTSGKFIVAYGEIMSQRAYYLASVADEIYLHPSGYMELAGFRSQLPFLKGTLDKLEIKPEVIYCGKYKSATEPLRLEKMSDENREQVSYLINDIYGRFVKKIGEARGIDSAMVDNIADSLLVRDAEDAVKYKLVNSLFFYDQVEARLKEKSGIGEKDELNLVKIEKYNKKDDEERETTKDKVAVLYATGDIVDGKGKDDNIGSERFAKAIREIRKDEKVKALVLRINSGGGSALASDVILREIVLAKEKMPVIVSMGDVAASGGYFIACMADTIIAEPNTITGSIGVFGLLFNMKDFFNNKLGVTFDGYNTGRFSDIGTPSRPLTEEERRIIQTGVDSIYMDFKEYVARGRDLTVGYVDSIAQGRIWTGVQAKERGLVDMLGSIDNAIAIAAEKAGLKDYETTDYPKVKEVPLQKLLEKFGDDSEEAAIKERLGEYYTTWKKLEALKNMRGIQARMPFDLEIN